MRNLDRDKLENHLFMLVQKVGQVSENALIAFFLETCIKVTGVVCFYSAIFNLGTKR